MSKKGFTLVEIMVVVAIIVILVGIAISAGSAAKAVARDNQRISDLQLIRLKLETYRDQNGVYPATLNQLVNSSFLAEIPKNPLGDDYKYAGTSIGSNTNCVSYHMGVVLETNSSSLQNAKHKTAGSTCAGSASDFDASAPVAGASSNMWYDVVSPDVFQ